MNEIFSAGDLANAFYDKFGNYWISQRSCKAK